MGRRRASVTGALALACAAGLGLAIALGPAPLSAQDSAPEDDTPAAQTPRGTGLPLPRFASLRADEVYMRAGPGRRYPIEWIYRRRGLPVQIIAEFDTWRKVRDWNGTVGWMHRAMLTGRRTGITTAESTTLYREPEANAPVVARAEAGVIVRLAACEGPWCRIEARGLEGWVPRAALWGTLPEETVD